VWRATTTMFTRPRSFTPFSTFSFKFHPFFSSSEQVWSFKSYEFEFVRNWWDHFSELQVVIEVVLIFDKSSNIIISDNFIFMTRFGHITFAFSAQYICISILHRLDSKQSSRSREGCRSHVQNGLNVSLAWGGGRKSPSGRHQVWNTSFYDLL